MTKSTTTDSTPDTQPDKLNGIDDATQTPAEA